MARAWASDQGVFFNSISLADVVAGKIPLGPDVPAVAEPQRIYFDYNATAPLWPEAHNAMIAALDVTGNPSSVHSEGRKARGVIEAARLSIARLINSKPSEIVFTSGATEANAWVMAQPFDTIFVAGVEHDSVLAAAHACNAEVVLLGVDTDGRGARRRDCRARVERLAGWSRAGFTAARQ